jgi:CheY-like chemotaxis protein
VEGIRIYTLSPRDLVITDLLMDGMEGVETIRRLSKLAPELPILAISGGGRADAEQCLTMACHLGAARALRKPFTLGELRDTVRELLEGAHAKVPA